MTRKKEKPLKEIVNGWIESFKNRKIKTLEREFEKTSIERDRLAHEIKLRTGIADNLLDIQRYRAELERLDG